MTKELKVLEVIPGLYYFVNADDFKPAEGKLVEDYIFRVGNKSFITKDKLYSLKRSAHSYNAGKLDNLTEQDFDYTSQEFLTETEWFNFLDVLAEKISHEYNLAYELRQGYKCIYIKFFTIAKRVNTHNPYERKISTKTQLVEAEIKNEETTVFTNKKNKDDFLANKEENIKNLIVEKIKDKLIVKNGDNNE